jgi:hypothetical protein
MMLHADNRSFRSRMLLSKPSALAQGFTKPFEVDFSPQILPWCSSSRTMASDCHAALPYQMNRRLLFHQSCATTTGQPSPFFSPRRTSLLFIAFRDPRLQITTPLGKQALPLNPKVL